MRSILVLLVLALALLPATGCVTVSKVYDGNPVTPEMAAFPKPGITTKAQVLQELGSPHHVLVADVATMTESLLTRASSDTLTVNLDPSLLDEIYVYERVRTQRFAFMTVVYNNYHSDTRSDRLTIIFDSEDKVLGVGYTQGLADER